MRILTNFSLNSTVRHEIHIVICADLSYLNCSFITSVLEDEYKCLKHSQFTKRRRQSKYMGTSKLVAEFRQIESYKYSFLK